MDILESKKLMQKSINKYYLIKLLVLVVLSTFLTEALVMFVISFLNISSVITEVLIDATALVILITPSFYVFFYIPLKKNLIKLHIAETIKKDNENQALIKDVLLLSLQGKKLDQILQEVLEIILSVSWLNIEAKGAIFLADEKSETLELKAFLNLNNSLINSCSNIPFGKCLCGKAALTREVVYKSKIDEDHHITDNEIIPHGHYCIPIIYNNLILGVINVYIKENTEYSEIEVTFLKNIAAAVGKIIVTYNDKEYIKNLNESLLAKNKLLEQSTYIISHDLQEPLQTITSFVNVIDKKYTNRMDTYFEEYFKFIKLSTNRMSNLIKNILEYSLLGKNSKLEKINCNEIIDNVINDLQYQINNTNTKIIFENLPEIYGYQKEVKQLFHNFLINSIKFRKPLTNPVITIKSQNDSKYWLFSIQDNGIGIDKKHYERIFQIFQRLHNRNEYEGIGVGLANCKRIIELHNGTLWLDSILNEGSTFYFTISKNLTKIE